MNSYSSHPSEPHVLYTPNDTIVTRKKKRCTKIKIERKNYCESHDADTALEYVVHASDTTILVVAERHDQHRIE